ncbi:type I-E CRISPR-associated protein Cse2/CasB [Actinopolyspora erythraea]|uniref:Type I-E CRISPR-associated protein Cse2/CasB n=1 Tax=Actinopolyspora erythraea TaxID=414996 RepID=A0A223RT86_9ACTN|nr:type I-E CRISPR-associated protein Cse2/CasB [Actinopolyspora erythraea]ASU79060.1 type I-E CRISPR-associated protein Cse2/CasB [Actinopolyspora erythraea]
MTEQGLQERQERFIGELRREAANLSAAEDHLVRRARQRLAELRRSVGRPYPAPAAYELVLRHDPPEAQEHVWLLTAGLFALHPMKEASGSRSLGGSLAQLHRVGSTEARLRQLVTVDPERLPHYLRQAVQLLRSHAIGIDYLTLLRDLCVLNSKNSDVDTHRVRLRWTRDYYRTVHAQTEKSSTKGSAA